MAGRPGRSDILTIRSDGTYRQEIDVQMAEGPPIVFEGDWQSWMLDFSEAGVAYLHLSGYRFCGMNPALSCAQTDGDGYDFCRDKSLSMDDEGILLVLGTNTEDTPPGSEVYYLHFPLGSEDSWVYTLRGP
jgi:hypothetical protein